LKLECKDRNIESNVGKKIAKKKTQIQIGPIGHLKGFCLYLLPLSPFHPIRGHDFGHFLGKRRGANHKANFISSVLM